ncbi:MAG: GSCFA domain-containing protein [Muribaculaceae bacterium]|nr:GSCFA domain-containing protein [Muribaculaceae bacterium]
MKFRTEYPAIKSSIVLHPDKPVIMVGSCFTQNITAKMEEHLWKTINPCGTLYNPLSIAEALLLVADYDSGLHKFEDSLFNYNGIWNSRIFDSSISSASYEDCISEFRQRQTNFLNALQEGADMIVTFGTSIVYYWAENDLLAGNCHKLPANLFYRERLSILNITDTWNLCIKRLKVLAPGLRIIFTVSPVRHLKDGFSENLRSKALLCLAVEEITKTNDNCDYFPAYEILNDDLRDYRFYASDLVHPSTEAIEYIWDKFKETYLDNSGLHIIENNGRKFKALHHRPKLGALGKPLLTKEG